MPTLEEARAWYPESDPVHGFDHVLRVLELAENLARAEGADLEIVRVSVLLHDARIDPDNPEDAGDRQNHHVDSANFAGRILQAEGWNREKIELVKGCILAHRYRDNSIEPETTEAKVVFDADKLDAIGATGAARAIAFAAVNGQPFYAVPSQRFLETGDLETGEPHSAYHEYLFKLSKIKRHLFTDSGRILAEERHGFMVKFFEQLGEEQRAER